MRAARPNDCRRIIFVLMPGQVAKTRSPAPYGSGMEEELGKEVRWQCERGFECELGLEFECQI